MSNEGRLPLPAEAPAYVEQVMTEIMKDGTRTAERVIMAGGTRDPLCIRVVANRKSYNVRFNTDTFQACVTGPGLDDRRYTIIFGEHARGESYNGRPWVELAVTAIPASTFVQLFMKMIGGR